ncbi:hypothetical protein AB4059_03145 [Lysobacter sp. 2RAF19]
MRKSVCLLLPVLALLALSACKREPAAPIAPAATLAAPATLQAPAPAPATVAPAMGVSESPAPGEHTTFDAKAFAGTFTSEGMDVAFAADGTYTLNSHAAQASTGTWSLEPDARHIRLDPNAKSEDDRVYELVDNDHLKAANGPQVLRRAGIAQ